MMLRDRRGVSVVVSFSLFFPLWTTAGYIWDITMPIQRSVGFCRSSSNARTSVIFNEHEGKIEEIHSLAARLVPTNSTVPIVRPIVPLDLFSSQNSRNVAISS